MLTNTKRNDAKLTDTRSPRLRTRHIAKLLPIRRQHCAVPIFKPDRPTSIFKQLVPTARCFWLQSLHNANEMHTSGCGVPSSSSDADVTHNSRRRRDGGEEFLGQYEIWRDVRSAHEETLHDCLRHATQNTCILLWWCLLLLSMSLHRPEIPLSRSRDLSAGPSRFLCSDVFSPTAALRTATWLEEQLCQLENAASCAPVPSLKSLQIKK